MKIELNANLDRVNVSRRCHFSWQMEQAREKIIHNNYCALCVYNLSKIISAKFTTRSVISTNATRIYNGILRIVVC